MAFDIVKYLENNKIELGSIKKEVGTNISKSGQNDLRRTTYDVKIKDGKFDLSTHKSIMSESKSKIIKENFPIKNGSDLLKAVSGAKTNFDKLPSKLDVIIQIGNTNYTDISYYINGAGQLVINAKK